MGREREGERAVIHKTKTSMSPEAEKVPALSGQILFITHMMCMLLPAFATENNCPVPSSWLWQQEEVKQLKV